MPSKQLFEIKTMKNNDTVTDELLEEWDWESARPLGRSVSRKKAHNEGIPHEGVHLWIIRTAHAHIELLFQHRSAGKELYPDCLDITVGGHVVFGHKEKKIQKESREEIGIEPDDEELIDLGYFRYEEKNGILYHREFQRVYLLIDNRPLDRYVFTDGEVEGIYAVPVDALKRLFVDDFPFVVDGYDGRQLVKRTVSRRDFHPLLFAESMDAYMKTVLIAVIEIVNMGRVTVRMPTV